MSAVALSIATSAGPAGQRPATSVSGLNRLSPFASWLKPRFAPLPAEITLPFRPTRWVAWSVSEPTAAATSGSACTLGRTVSGKPKVPWLLPFVAKAVLPVITAEVFSYETLKIVSKPALIVSVRM